MFCLTKNGIAYFNKRRGKQFVLSRVLRCFCRLVLWSLALFYGLHNFTFISGPKFMHLFVLDYGDNVTSTKMVNSSLVRQWALYF